jgi:hypothetical protein
MNDPARVEAATDERERLHDLQREYPMITRGFA